MRPESKRRSGLFSVESFRSATYLLTAMMGRLTWTSVLRCVAVFLLALPACKCQRDAAPSAPVERPQVAARPAAVPTVHAGWSARRADPAGRGQQITVGGSVRETPIQASKAPQLIAGEAGDQSNDDSEPSVRIDAEPNSGGAPLTVQFQSEIEPVREGLHMVWDFGDGTSARDIKSPQHVYKSAGNYEAVLTILWPSGSDEASVGIDVEEDTFDVTVEADPSSGPAPLQVEFAATADVDDEDLPQLRFEWDLGGGVKGFGPHTQHSYRQPGTYTIQVVAISPDGHRGRGEIELEVEEPGEAE